MLDRDMQFFTGAAHPIRDFEAVFEMTYAHEVRPGFVLQPVLQYAMHPGGGGVVDPDDPKQMHRIRDALMVGVRTTISY